MGIVFGKISVETPKHEVILQLPNCEVLNTMSCIVAPHTVQIREYPAQVAASVTLADFSENKAFRILADYIGAFPGSAPKNKRQGSAEDKVSETVAMTAPVLVEKAEPVAMTAPVMVQDAEAVAMTAPVLVGTGASSGAKTMTFLLPAKYTVATAPQPTDSRVEIHEVPKKYYAVQTFSYGWSEEKCKSIATAIEAEITKQDGYSTVGSGETLKWLRAGYNPPFTLPFLRTNEVMVQIEPEH